MHMTSTLDINLYSGRMRFGTTVTSDGVIVVAGGAVGSLVGDVSNEVYTSDDRGKTWKLFFASAPWKGINFHYSILKTRMIMAASLIYETYPLHNSSKQFKLRFPQ